VQDGTPDALWSAIEASGLTSADTELYVSLGLTHDTGDLSAATDSLEMSMRVGDLNGNWADWQYDAVAYERAEAPPVYTIATADYDSLGPGGDMRVLMSVTTDKSADVHMAWRLGYAGDLATLVEADGLVTALDGTWETDSTMVSVAGDTLHYLAYNGSDEVKAHTTTLIERASVADPAPDAPTGLTATVGDYTAPDAPTGLTATVGGS